MWNLAQVLESSLAEYRTSLNVGPLDFDFKNLG